MFVQSSFVACNLITSGVLLRRGTKRKKMQHLNQRGTFDAGNNEIAISLITSRAELILKEGKQRVSE